MDRATLAPQIRLRRPAFPHDYVEHARTTPAELVDRLAGATIAILNKVRLDAAAIAQLPTLRLVGTRQEFSRTSNRICMSNSFAFGGSNASLLIGDAR